MTTLTPDAIALCRVIDSGDDTALPILADALEEAGNELAAGLRSARTIEARPRDWAGHGRTSGWAHRSVPFVKAGVLSSGTFARLRGGRPWRRKGEGGRLYLTRSAAYLALAQAIVDSDQ